MKKFVLTLMMLVAVVFTAQAQNSEFFQLGPKRLGQPLVSSLDSLKIANFVLQNPGSQFSCTGTADWATPVIENWQTGEHASAWAQEIANKSYAQDRMEACVEIIEAAGGIVAESNWEFVNKASERGIVIEVIPVAIASDFYDRNPTYVEVDEFDDGAVIERHYYEEGFPYPSSMLADPRDIILNGPIFLGDVNYPTITPKRYASVTVETFYSSFLQKHGGYLTIPANRFTFELGGGLIGNQYAFTDNTVTMSQALSVSPKVIQITPITTTSTVENWSGYVEGVVTFEFRPRKNN